MGHLTFVSKTSVSGRKQKDFAILSLIQHVSRVHGSLLLSRAFFCCCLFKVWSEDKLNKKFVVAENFAELVSEGKRFCLSVYFMSAWRDRVGDLTLFEPLLNGWGI